MKGKRIGKKQSIPQIVACLRGEEENENTQHAIPQIENGSKVPVSVDG